MTSLDHEPRLRPWEKRVSSAPSVPKKPRELSTGLQHHNDKEANHTSSPALTELPERLSPAISASKPQTSINGSQSSQKELSEPHLVLRRHMNPKLSVVHLSMYTSSSPHNLITPTYLASHSMARLKSSTTTNASRDKASYSRNMMSPDNGMRLPASTTETFQSPVASGTNSASTKLGFNDKHSPLFSSGRPQSTASSFKQHTTFSSPISTGATSFSPLNQRKANPDLETLVEMGFDYIKAKRALEASNGQLQAAIDRLINTAGETDRASTPAPSQDEDLLQLNTGSSAGTPKAATEAPTQAAEAYQTRFSAASAWSSLGENRNGRDAGEEDSDSSDEDPAIERQREEEWKKQQERIRKEYLMQRKQQQEQQNRPTREGFTSSYPKASLQTPSPLRSQASTDTVTIAAKEKFLGDEQYNLGHFDESITSYSRALAALPRDHDQVAVVSNLRAAARMKCGDYKRAVADADTVLDIARPKTISITDSSEYWRQQVITALGQKAAALEHIERYKEALTIYDELANTVDTNNPQWSQAAARCRTFGKKDRTTIPSTPQQSSSTSQSQTSAFPNLDYSIFEMQSPVKSRNPSPAFPNVGSARASPIPRFSTPSSAVYDTSVPSPLRTSSVQTPATQKPQPSETMGHGGFAASAASSPMKPKPSTAKPVVVGKALASYRAREAELQAEEAEKLKKADFVNDRINSWKSGKENNLRALLASLDMLMWHGAQWRGTPMSELVDPKRCKIAYMKAIAKVHPDKLPASTTVEQRMLASGIFTTLNGAWDAFKQQNNL
ncbi:uncharacterized protein BYT42DRAFT_613222 [Radiomyces spectabilis]|uniref:uncharacterized protein n=1 Tax=Radiomyces spectabilis TaxID=64574 RepID=UPI00221F0FF9|nr:uncharacterized protein BYT42DRAFT_613222 [Radiomyces spectabilis]KAI8381445.1 hypothetical protein BYT42DRAFT_613222 [Radiomyces spectabilis]